MVKLNLQQFLMLLKQSCVSITSFLKAKVSTRINFLLVIFDCLKTNCFNFILYILKEFLIIDENEVES